MRKILFLATVAAAAVASPAYARDGSPYVGLEGGIIFPETKDVNGSATFTSTAPIGAAPLGEMRFKKGYDVDVIGGYDLGLFRIEGELGYKHSSVKRFSLLDTFVNGVNTESGNNFTGNTFGFSRKFSILDAMLNGMLDVGDNGWSGFAGGGVGYARVKELGDSHSGAAWQAIAGV